MTASIEKSTSNPWARVCDLVDLKAPVLSVSSRRAGGGGGGSRKGVGGGSRSGSRGGSRGGSGTGGGVEEEDAFQATAKMRSLIIQVGGWGKGRVAGGLSCFSLCCCFFCLGCGFGFCSVFVRFGFCFCF